MEEAGRFVVLVPLLLLLLLLLIMLVAVVRVDEVAGAGELECWRRGEVAMPTVD